MGFNSTLVVLNDALGEIENDPNFGRNVAKAIMEMGAYPKPGQHVDIVAGHHGNAATVVDCHHADSSALILVGGNYGTVVQPHACGWDHENGQEEALRIWADNMGFRLVRKSKKKS